MLKADVAGITGRGFWLQLDGRKVFLAFRDFPWFREATAEQITHVTRPQPHHLHWPDLDVDLAVESIDHPDRYPLISKTSPRKT